MEEYEKLKKLGFPISKIEQLLFLYRYSDKETYTKFLTQVENKYCAKQLEQLIKCITHNTPYALLLNPKYSVFIMNEIRRYLEDTLHENGIHTTSDTYYYKLGEEMLKHEWDECMIYQLRRFVKGKKIASLKTIEQITKIVFQYKIKDWMILNILYQAFLNQTEEDFLYWFLVKQDDLKHYSKLKTKEEKIKFQITFWMEV